MRLDKFLVECGVGTRKKCREEILNGFVKVNDEVILKPAIEINEESDIVKFKDNKISYRGKVYYKFNKPMGCITARSDKINKTVFEYFKNINMNGVSHVGRLDKDTEGLLLFTNDGEFSNELMRPESHVDKKYYFIALGFIDEEKAKKLENGIYIGNDEPITKKAKLEIVKSGEYSTLQEELDLDKYYKVNKEYYNQEIVAGYLTISEGRKHQVKRMLKAVGCYIVYLKRISIGNISLDDSLKIGEYKELSCEEVEELTRKL